MHDLHTFERFYKENYAFYFRQAYYLVGDEEVCRDIVSDCYEQLWLAFCRTEVENLSSYMYTLVRRMCIDHLRREMVKEKYVDFYCRMTPETFDECREEEEKLEFIYQTMDKLPQRTRHILEECYLHHKKYQEVAEEMDISTSTVKKHIIKALKELRSQIVNFLEKK
ncbi:sigma-70 family RNA polymerase sigma factor [Bacteroides cellulosilyticus]|uniref:sigma-70 family RNA polymerase sigma factor n=1 Tax=Bacteroides cellulosilyticus TaxID=246787 RepID=UPI0022E6AEDF|nr:sigma-70 family RNA polymerase sigma factor [Bacteroides cellulosilyticus]